MKVSQRVHIGGHFGGEPKRIEGNQDAKPQVNGFRGLIAPGRERVSRGLENRYGGDPDVGSNPTPPAPARGHPDRPTTNQTPCTASSPRFQSR